MLNKFLKDLKSFSIYNLVYSKIKFAFYPCLTFILIIPFITIYLVVSFQEKESFVLIIFMLSMIAYAVNYFILNYFAKKYITSTYHEVEFSYFNNNFIYEIKKLELEKYLKEKNNEINSIYLNDDKFRDFISSYSKRIEDYKYKGFYFIVIIGTFSAIALSNLIQITYEQKDISEAVQITLGWVIIGFIFSILISILRKMFIELYEMKYSSYKQLLNILEELYIEKEVTSNNKTIHGSTSASDLIF